MVIDKAGKDRVPADINNFSLEGNVDLCLRTQLGNDTPFKDNDAVWNSGRFVASFAISLGPVMWVLFSEVFPNRIRGIAIGFATIFNSGASFLVQFLFPWHLNPFGTSATFALFAVVGLLGMGLIWRLPETKGETLERLETKLA